MARYEATIQTYPGQGWDIIYPDGSSEKHLEVGWVGGYGVFFGDHRDTADYIPLREEQTNNRGELRAALRKSTGAQGRTPIRDLPRFAAGGQWSARPGSTWRRHGWQNKSGAVAHVDMWTQISHLVEKLGEAIKWLHVPSHIGIKGNGRADHLADVGRRRSPLLFRLICIRPPPPHPRRRGIRPRARRMHLGVGGGVYLATSFSAQRRYRSGHPTGIQAGNAGQTKVATADPVGGH